MNHSFDVDIAKEYGIEEAIMLQHLYFWIEKNKANNKHFYNDTYWTYNTKKAFADLLPYMTPRKIDYTLKNLVDKGLVITGNFNQDGRDRTLWYALTKMGYCILQNCKLQNTKLSNDNNINNINNTNTDNNNPDDKIHIIKENIKRNPEQEILEYWNQKGIIHHKEVTEKRKKAITKALKEHSVDDIKTAIDHFEEMLHSKYEYCDYAWSLEEFLSREKGFTEFLNDGSKWINYLNWKKKQQDEKPVEHIGTYLR